MWLKAVKWVGLVTLALGVVLSVYKLGHKAGSDRVTARWNQDRAALQQQLTASELATRAAEQAHAAEVARITDTLHQELTHAQTEQHRIITDLQLGNVRLRDRLAARTVCVSDPATGARGSDAAGDVGLSKADAEFLVRLATRADDITRRLTACQSILLTERSDHEH